MRPKTVLVCTILGILTGIIMCSYYFVPGFFLAFVSLIISIFFNLFTIVIPANSILLSNAGNVENYIAERRYDWNANYKGLRLVTLGKECFQATSEVTPITTNPKVRRISYIVKAEADQDTIKKFQKVRAWAKSKFTNNLEKGLDYELYEFNNEYSKELAELYNPKEPTQQAKFLLLVREFFEKRAPKEISITNATFELA